MPALPTGTVTFLYTDVEGSTRRWEEKPQAMRLAMQRHDGVLRAAIHANGGLTFRTEGDAFRAAFSSAPQALQAALDAQRGLLSAEWPQELGPLRVRIALHTGLGDVQDEDYVGPPLNRVARLLAVGHGGQTLVSQATYELVRDSLPGGVTLRDMGEHQLKDLQRPERIYQVVAPGLPISFPPLRTLDARPNNLPVQRSPLVGREKELAAIQQLLLRDDVGLVTLTGPGGTGKTRLALQIAAEMADHFHDGVFFVPLANITDRDLVATAIAQTLGVMEVPGQSLAASLIDYLGSRQILLVLDNFEQVIVAAPVVADLLRKAAKLQVLATSRETLHLQGEQEFNVPPLSLPDLKHLPPIEQLSQYEAVALFIQRARQVKPDFEATNQNAPAIAEICYRLDGLPLAIELAAARTRLLAPDAMLARLARGKSAAGGHASPLQLLTGGARDLPERHQTIRNTIQWSYDLLPPSEQILFRRISVFVGGCMLDAVEAICNTDGRLEVDVLDGVASLVDKSLLRQEASAAGYPKGEPRFMMLETIREYAMELLQESDEIEAQSLLRQHAMYYLEMAETAESKFQGPEQKVWLDRIETEHDNMRAAYTWAFERGQAGYPEGVIAMQLGSTLWFFWQTRVYYSEGRKWLESALSIPGADAPSAARAGALQALAHMAWLQYDYAATRAFGEESLALWRELDKRGEASSKGIRSLAYALVFAGTWAGFTDDTEEGLSHLQEGLALLRKLGDKWGTATALLDLAIAENGRGNHAPAQASLHESLALYREIGDKWGQSQVLNIRGDIARIYGDYDQAKTSYEESLNLYRELNIKADIPASLHNLGYVELAQGDVAKARELFVESLRLQVEAQNNGGIAENLSGLAGVAGASGEPERAARLFGAADAIFEALKATRWPAEKVAYERNLAVARAQLDAATWERAWAEGRAMEVEQAIAYALESTQPEQHTN